MRSPRLAFTLFVAAAVPPLDAAVLYVGDPLDGACNFSQLQAAIDAAAALPAEDEIRLSNGGAYVDMALSIGAQDLTIVGGFDDCSDISASGYTSIRGTPDNSVFTVTGSGVRELRNLVIHGGQSEDGGAIRYAGSGALRLDRSVLEANAAIRGGAIYVKGIGAQAVVHLLNGTRISDNQASNGGGIFADDHAHILMSDELTCLARNHASELGGGVMLRNRTLLTIESPGIPALGTIFENTARRGGAIALVAGNHATNFPKVTASGVSPPVFHSNTAQERGGVFYSKGFAEDTIQGFGNEAWPLVDLKEFSITRNQAALGAVYFSESMVGDDEVGSTLKLGIDATPCEARRCRTITRNSSPGFAGSIFHDQAGTVSIAHTVVNSNSGKHLFEMDSSEHTALLLIQDALLAKNPVTGAFAKGRGAESLVQIERSTVVDIGPGPLISVQGDSTVTASQSILTMENRSAPLVEGATTLSTAENLVSHTLGLSATDATSFVAPARFQDEANFDFRTRIGSPAVDRIHTPVFRPVDIDSQPRDIDLSAKPNPSGFARDVGAYENQGYENLLLNPSFASDIRIWWVPASLRPFITRSASDANADSASGSLQASIPGAPAVPQPGGNITVASQCVHLPGPGTYRLAGRAFRRASGEATESPYIAWRYRQFSDEQCTGDGSISDYGYLSFGTALAGGGWVPSAEPYVNIEVSASEWTENSSIEVKLDVTRSASAPADGPLFARFDDLSLVLLGATTNAIPIANADFVEVSPGGVATTTSAGGTLLSNDFDLDADSLRVNPTPVTAPIHGTLVLGIDGSFRYENTAAGEPSDHFTYEVCDGEPAGCDRAEVFIEIEQTSEVFSSGFESGVL